MNFRVRIDPLAQRDIDDFAVYTGTSYTEELAIEQFARLNEIFSDDLAQHPLRWTFFPLTGAPYRGYLFRVGRRARYWIIYTADEDRRTIKFLCIQRAHLVPDARIWDHRGIANPGHAYELLYELPTMLAAKSHRQQIANGKMLRYMHPARA
jgi:plasmid stabilization system protein ParE